MGNPCSPRTAGDLRRQGNREPSLVQKAAFPAVAAALALGLGLAACGSSGVRRRQHGHARARCSPGR